MDHNAHDLDENDTQAPDTAIVPLSYFHDSTTDQNQETHRIVNSKFSKLGTTCSHQRSYGGHRLAYFR